MEPPETERSASACSRRSRVQRSLSIAILIAALYSLFVADALYASTRRALLVGINKYTSAVPADGHHPETGRTSWNDLSGCLNDVTAMREVLLARFGFKADEILVVTESRATRAGILAAYRSHLVEPVKPGDSLLFYYAGHGSQVANSKSKETDRRDESIVPADSNAGAADIRDKELAALFNESMARGGTLTVILDSCHSGSGSRGLPRRERSRSLPPDPRDVADAAQPIPPENIGALILSASQDYQTAGEAESEDGTPHGLFSAALIATLRRCPVNEPADRIFLTTRALMQASGRAQEPVLAGRSDRRRAPLFGGVTRDVGTVVSVAKTGLDSVNLHAGNALGLTVGSELRRISPTGAEARIRITRVNGLASSTAAVLKVDARPIAAGDLFEVDRWVAPDVPTLRVHVNTSPFSRVDLATFADELRRTVQANGARWVEDPTSETPSHVVSWDGGKWMIYDSSKNMDRTLASALSVRDVARKIPAASHTSVFLNVPSPRELGAALRLGAGTPNDSIALDRTADTADYLLTGRAIPGRTGMNVEFAWVRPNTLQENVQALPARTDWLGGNTTATAKELERSALRLGKIAAWLKLTPPPDRTPFPYRLALQRTNDGRIVDQGDVREGESYGLVLRTADDKPPTRIRPRWVYVFVIDSHGTSTLLFPESGMGNVENQIPRSLGDQVVAEGLPAQIQIGPRDLFSVEEPFGADTYVLLTSADPLPDPGVLEGEGVRTRGSTKGSSSLAVLLGGLGASSRGVSPRVPATWSLERLTIVSRK